MNLSVIDLSCPVLVGLRAGRRGHEQAGTVDGKPMKLFECQNCDQPLYFENTRCESCGLTLGYLPARETVTALQPDAKMWMALAVPDRRYRYCANAMHEVCNWLIPADSADELCAACRHNRMIPDLTQPQNLGHWRVVERAKHRLFYTLLKLRLPLVTKAQDPDGLADDIRRHARELAASLPDVILLLAPRP